MMKGQNTSIFFVEMSRENFILTIETLSAQLEQLKEAAHLVMLRRPLDPICTSPLLVMVTILV